MINVYNDNKITLEQQVQENKKDITGLNKIVKKVYHTKMELSDSSFGIAIGQTNAPSGTDNAWLIDINGKLFDIVGNYTTESGENLTIVYFCDLKGVKGDTGAAGVGISTIENDGYSQGEGFTISHIKSTLTDGTTEYFDVQAKDGASGELPFITINAPASATSGTLTAEQLSILQNSNNSYILLNNEKYYLMDIKHESGYLIFAYSGYELNQFYNAEMVDKCIAVTINTLSWMLVAANSLYYRHFITLSDKNHSKIYYFVLESKTKSDDMTTIVELRELLSENGADDNNGNWCVSNITLTGIVTRYIGSVMIRNNLANSDLQILENEINLSTGQAANSNIYVTDSSGYILKDSVYIFRK